ncbi:hypothetical protein CDAR_400781 [Caerostris darwini]|uniref:RNA ligase/cyclic nucleotide phosphodiesterase family protein n=1 Tax=Caerostris darwini TaxID=1538125 RepID=A0AAV4NC38_9ARAC|nr:hypothetical protein CDAR_400781 [Caerostris darwini]
MRSGKSRRIFERRTSEETGGTLSVLQTGFFIQVTARCSFKSFVYTADKVKDLELFSKRVASIVVSEPHIWTGLPEYNPHISIG